MNTSDDTRAVLITGAAGRIGQAVTPALLEAGYHVIALDRSPVRTAGVQRLVGDLLDPELCYRAIDGVDAVIHLANYASPESGPPAVHLRENVVMDLNVFTAAAQLGIRRVVFASSIQAMTRTLDDGGERIDVPPMRLPLDESHPVLPSNTYGLSKVLGERALDYFGREYAIDGFSAVSLRLPWVVPESRLPDLAKIRTIEGWARWGIGEAFAYVAEVDAVDAIRLALEADVQGHEVLFTAAPDPRVNIPVGELIDRFYRDVPVAQAGPIDSLVDCGKAARVLGWRPRRSWRDLAADADA
ncbi:MAG: NAD(P)-dependent oxidoreductase [Phycisphaerales bacterium]|nr:NAD(P)-dependent oxidoreductase [Phycisphaerales bacterium]